MVQNAKFTAKAPPLNYTYVEQHIHTSVQIPSLKSEIEKGRVPIYSGCYI